MLWGHIGHDTPRGPRTSPNRPGQSGAEMYNWGSAKLPREVCQGHTDPILPVYRTGTVTVSARATALSPPGGIRTIHKTRTRFPHRGAIYRQRESVSRTFSPTVQHRAQLSLYRCRSKGSDLICTRLSESTVYRLPGTLARRQWGSHTKLTIIRHIL